MWRNAMRYLGLDPHAEPGLPPDPFVRRAPPEYAGRFRGELSRRLEDRWQLVEDADDGAMWRGEIDGEGVDVVWSVAVESDGEIWLRVTVCTHELRWPTWPEMAAVKALFVGPHRYAYQVHPSDDEAPTPRVLELFALYSSGRRPLPDFTHGTRGW